jgi:hypothetical protein
MPVGPSCRHLIAFGLIIISTVSIAQKTGNDNNVEVSPGKLATVQTVNVVGQPSLPLILPIRCDTEGSYYVRFYHADQPESLLKDPVYRFDTDGIQQAVYSLPPGPEFEPGNAGIMDFAIAANGDLYMLVETEGGNTIVRFNRAGEFKAKARLEQDFNARRFAVFESGNFLIAGVARETATNLTPHSPRTAIYDRNGKLLKKLTLPDDKQYEEAADRGDTEFFDLGRGGGGNFAVERGSVVRSSDGNIYVVRWTSPVKVYSISPEGEVIRSFEVNVGNSNKKPGAVHEHGGAIAIQFPAERDDPTSMIRVVESDGKEKATYDAAGLGAAFSCYLPRERMAFLRSDGKHLVLNVVEPK